MTFLLRSIAGQNRCLIRALGRRYFAASTQEYAKRNYANNVSEYNTVINSISSKRGRHYLLRDVYDDMMLDGVQPTAEVFHSLVVGVMKGARMQDALFFREEMKAMGIAPDVNLYNFLISICGKCKKSDQAIQVFEEMKRYEVKPNGQTYVCLLNACAADGRLDLVYAIVRDMTAAGAGLNQFCYAGLIAAHLNKVPRPDNLATKILELVEQSKGWSPVDSSRRSAESMMFGVTEEELYNIPTAEYAHRTRFLHRHLTVYHVAFNALADLRDVEAMEALLDMLKKDGKETDSYIVTQIMRCYLHSGDLDNGLKWFQDYTGAGRPSAIELFTTLVEGAMTGYTPKGMQLAQDTLVQMNARNYYLDPRSGSALLLKAAGEKTGGYTTANYIWDLMQARKINPTLPAVEAYYNGLKEREIPENDPRLLIVSRTYDNLRLRIGTASSAQQQ